MADVLVVKPSAEQIDAFPCDTGNNTEPQHETGPSLNTRDHPFPLLRRGLDKEDLLHFIKMRVEYSWQRIEGPTEVESYFFWRIMELYCRQDGVVMLCEVGFMLMKGYDLLRKKRLKTQTWKNWCVPLARLLFSAAPADEHREALIKMGENLASRDLIYPSHICYVLAKIELGSRRDFQLIGCDSSLLPFGITTLIDPLLRSETYEYVLWLNSGRAQPSFQIFKLCLASREAAFYSPSRAVQYCEVITQAVLSFPDRITRSFVDQLLLLSCKLYRSNAEKPDWLLELQQLHKNKLENADLIDEPEQHIRAFTQGFVELPPTENESVQLNPVLQPPGPMEIAELEAWLSSRYQLGDLLGHGCFGFVFKGVRITDQKNVAVKVIKKSGYTKNIGIPGITGNVPAEVALLMKVSQPPACSNIIELLDWFDMGYQFVMVMERPSPSMDLLKFMELHNGYLSEEQARHIMAQVIRAAHHCCVRGVVHRDIKAENIIISPESMEVKLIDFGCGELLKDAPSKDFFGTLYFAPPEWVFFGGYMGVPATVWALGVLLFHLLTGKLPFLSPNELDFGYLKELPDLSQECFQLLMWCLDLNPETRPSFQQLARHDWFIGGSSGQSQDLS